MFLGKKKGGWDSNPESGVSQLAVNGNALDNTVIRTGPI